MPFKSHEGLTASCLTDNSKEMYDSVRATSLMVNTIREDLLLEDCRFFWKFGNLGKSGN